MIELAWRVKPEVDKQLLQNHLDIMQKRSGLVDNFAVRLPVLVYEYIRDEGINAEFTRLPDNTSPGMVWVRVRKLKPEKSHPACSNNHF